MHISRIHIFKANQRTETILLKIEYLRSLPSILTVVYRWKQSWRQNCTDLGKGRHKAFSFKEIDWKSDNVIQQVAFYSLFTNTGCSNPATFPNREPMSTKVVEA